MKNVGSILALVAFSATFVSARAVPALDSIAARVAYPEAPALHALAERKNKAVSIFVSSSEKLLTNRPQAANATTAASQKAVRAPI
jgi:hypothetical protein